MEQKENKNRSFLGKLLVFIFAVLAFLGLVAMALSVINAYINPQHFIWTTVFGLAFWVILIFNVVVFFFLLLLWSNKIWISVLALLIAIPGISKSFSFGSKEKADNSIRIMSYNVHQFITVNKEMDKEQLTNRLMDMVREQSPDILCCQEFGYFKTGKTRPKGILQRMLASNMFITIVRAIMRAMSSFLSIQLPRLLRIRGSVRRIHTV